MAGTVTKTEQTLSSVKKVTFNWTLSSGQATSTTVNSYDGEVLRINAMACACTGYALLLEDNDGTDLLGAQGAALTSGGYDFGTRTSTTGAAELPLSAVSSKLTLDITASCGDCVDTGRTIVYIR